jgi:hypothetical protein
MKYQINCNNAMHMYYSLYHKSINNLLLALQYQSQPRLTIHWQSCQPMAYGPSVIRMKEYIKPLIPVLEQQTTIPMYATFYIQQAEALYCLLSIYQQGISYIEGGYEGHIKFLDLRGNILRTIIYICTLLSRFDHGFYTYMYVDQMDSCLYHECDELVGCSDGLQTFSELFGGMLKIIRTGAVLKTH